MRIVRTRTELADWRLGVGDSLGFVPTMGHLHDGHLALIQAARAENRHVAVSIFVNPTQFGANEDLASYPRTLAADRAKLEASGCDLLFLPEPATMYPPGFATFVEPGAEAASLCGQFRPGHFRGVCTVVALLFHLVRPDHAYFGAKDWQQAMVLRRMVLDLAFPLTLIVHPTVREADGLAMSSRNHYLSPEERRQAPALQQALAAAVTAYAAGERHPAALIETVRRTLATEPAFRPQYVELRDAETLAAPDNPLGERPAVLAAAAYLGSTRLIDNVLLGDAHHLLQTRG